MKEIKKQTAEDLSVKDKMSLILDVGQLMMENGSESTRLVRDMLRTAAYFGIYWEQIQLHITYTTIMMNVDAGEQSYTMFRKCYRHGVNMAVILKVSQLSWEALQKNYSYRQFQDKLKEIRKNTLRRSYPQAFVFFCGALASGGFCMLFGGNVITAVYTMIAAIIGILARYACDSLEVNSYVGIAVSAFASTFAAYFAFFLPGSNEPWLPMISCALTLIPGLPMINAVNDFLSNYLTAGTTRMTHTILILFAMTFGIVTAVELLHMPEFTQMNIFPERLYLLQAFAAAMAAFGFCVLFNVPKRYLIMACIGAIITVDTRNICYVEFGMSMAASSFIGAAVLSTLCFLTARKLHAPAWVISIPAVIPMIPGVILYRFLFAIIQIDAMPLQQTLSAFRNGIDAVFVLLGIAVGVTVPDVLFHQLIAHSRRKRLQKLLVKRGGKEAELGDAADLDRAAERK